MMFVKIAPVLILVTLAGADKKIELEDIENDTLKSEKQKDKQKTESKTDSLFNQKIDSALNPFNFFKNKLVTAYLENTHQQPQQPRYVQQYAVTEAPERPVEITPKTNNNESPQHAMVSYLSNIPMQIYLVPQYYHEPLQQQANQPVSYGTGVAHGHPSAAEHNYVEYPIYVTASGRENVQQYTQPTFYTYSYPTVATTQPAVTTPIVTHQMPMVHYPTAITAPPVLPKEYYQVQHDSNPNVIGQPQEQGPKYEAQTEIPDSKSSPPMQEYPRYYNSRTPLREEYKYAAPPQLPPPNPLLLKGTPPHLSHLPKALPEHRPLNKPVYAAGGSFISSAYNQRPTESYGPPFRRRPTSLLDSYIPSSVQIEYLKRGYARDPVSVYEALSSGRQFPNSPVYPRQYERGFLPNQMYQTAAGSITYGHYKRAPTVENNSLNYI